MDGKRFHVEPVDPESWRRGNISRMVMQNVGERCLTWKRFGPKVLGPPRTDSVGVVNSVSEGPRIQASELTGGGNSVIWIDIQEILLSTT